MDTLTLRLDSVKPKARPRFYNGRALLPEAYRDWKSDAVKRLRKQVKPDFATIDKAAILVDLQGAIRGDLDNLAGGILDALVQAEILKDDRLSCVSELHIRHTPAKTRAVLICIQY